MKTCPQCHRTYTDGTLNFCLDDGEWLVGGGSSELATEIFPSEAQKRAHSADDVLSDPIHETSGKVALNRKLIFAVIGALLVAVLGLGVYWFFVDRTGKQINSIAVLPFQNKSSDADTDYLSDGLPESLIFRLSQLPGLKVSPTSSVIRYKGKDTDLASVANELGVDSVLTGRLVKRGDDLNITVELVDARSNKSLWGEQYTRKMSELLATQREIATTIADKLQLKLAGDQARGITKKYTDSNEAYQLYLKGRFYWNKRDEENIRKAIEQFKAAVDQDPKFALAYVGISDSHSVLPFYSSAAMFPEAAHQAKAYALRALEMDDSLGEAHTSLGSADRILWNWEEAEKELKRGIELSPTYATAHKFYANYLSDRGRFDESLLEFERAYELEPLSPIISGNLAQIYVTMGDTDNAIRYCEKALDLEPNWAVAHEVLSRAYLKAGRNDEALAEAQRDVDLSSRGSRALGILGYVYAKTGKRTEAVAVISEMEQRYGKGQTDATDIAKVYVGLGNYDQAFSWLEKDFKAHSQLLPSFLNSDPLDALRGDPRHADLLRRMGLTQ